MDLNEYMDTQNGKDTDGYPQDTRHNGTYDFSVHNESGLNLAGKLLNELRSKNRKALLYTVNSMGVVVGILFLFVVAGIIRERIVPLFSEEKPNTVAVPKEESVAPKAEILSSERIASGMSVIDQFKEVERLVLSDPTNPEHNYRLSLLLRQTEQPERAYKYAKIAMMLSPLPKSIAFPISTEDLAAIRMHTNFQYSALTYAQSLSRKGAESEDVIALLDQADAAHDTASNISFEKTSDLSESTRVYPELSGYPKKRMQGESYVLRAKHTEDTEPKEALLLKAANHLEDVYSNVGNDETAAPKLVDIYLQLANMTSDKEQKEKFMNQAHEWLRRDMQRKEFLDDYLRDMHRHF